MSMGLLDLVGVLEGEEPCVTVPVDVPVVRHRAAVQLAVGLQGRHHAEVDLFHRLRQSLLVELEGSVLLLLRHREAPFLSLGRISKVAKRTRMCAHKTILGTSRLNTMSELQGPSSTRVRGVLRPPQEFDPEAIWRLKA